MKTIKTLICALLIGAVSSSAIVTTEVTGEISFAGAVSFLDGSDVVVTDLRDAVKIDFGPSFITGVSGDYSIYTPGDSITVYDFTFDPFPVGGVDPLWSITNDPTTFFALTSLVVVEQEEDSLKLRGEGIGYMDGKEPNEGGTWILTANTLGSTFSYSSTSSVPDSGTTVAMLGLGLIALGATARRFKNTRS